MAWHRTTPTEDEGATTGDFGTVSRTVGLVFRYLLLAATLAGIVALGVLLVFVANDAFRPLSAEPAWLALAGLTAVLPPLAVGAWLRRREAGVLRSGLAATGLLFVGVLFSGGATIVFTDVVPPMALFAHLAALLVPAAVAIGLERVDGRVPFVVRVAVVLLAGAVALSTVPDALLSLPRLPADWVIVLATVGGPAAAVAAWYVRSRFESRPLARRTGAMAFAGVWAIGAAGVALGVNPAALTMLGIVGLLPFGLYVGTALYDRGRSAVGVALPFVVVGGTAALLGLERLLDLQGPHAWLTWDFLTAVVSAPATEAGVYPGIAGTILLMIVVVLASFPVGVGAAVYLEEYADDTWFTRLIDVNISNLAGVPSVVYGLLGLGAFVRFGGLAPGTVLVGGMTLALLILPIVIINSREAIKAVPDSQRQAAFGMGATRWQVVRSVVLPKAFPAILTGTILALGRAVGETAPLLVIGAPAIFGVPGQLGDRVGAIPLQIYTWASAFADEAFFTTVLAAGVVTILVVLLTMNSIAIVLRNRFQRDT